MTLSPAAISKIEKRAEAATPGPWEGDDWGVSTLSPDHQKIDGTSGWREPGNRICNSYDGEYIENENSKNDAAFVAHARQDIPMLLAEVRRLQSERDKALKKRDATTERYQREHDIVDRIWTQLGRPTFDELAGRSIYDLIDALKAERDSALARADAMQKVVEAARKITFDEAMDEDVWALMEAIKALDAAKP